MTILTIENMTFAQRAAIKAILAERDFQDEKYGPVLDSRVEGDKVIHGGQGRGGHELGAWLVIIESELDEAKKALVHGGSKSTKGRDTIRAEIVQIAAVALAALEQHGVEEPKCA